MAGVLEYPQLMTRGKLITSTAVLVLCLGRQGASATSNQASQPSGQAPTITFKAGETILGTAPVSGGRATLSMTLEPGVHRVTATHSADSLSSPPYFQLVRGQ